MTVGVSSGVLSDDTTRQGDPGAGMNVSFMLQSSFDLPLAQMYFYLFAEAVRSKETRHGQAPTQPIVR
jgi:hypothetical protein